MEVYDTATPTNTAPTICAKIDGKSGNSKRRALSSSGVVVLTALGASLGRVYELNKELIDCLETWIFRNDAIKGLVLSGELEHRTANN